MNPTATAPYKKMHQGGADELHRGLGAVVREDVVDATKADEALEAADDEAGDPSRQPRIFGAQ